MMKRMMVKGGGEQIEVAKRRKGTKENPIWVESPLQHPWLLLHGEGKTLTSPFYYKGCCTRFPPSLGVKQVLNCCYGWLILSNFEDFFFLWNPVKSRLVEFPRLTLKPDQRIRNAVLWSPPCEETGDLNPNCMIILFQDDYDYHRSESWSLNYCLLRENHKRWISVYSGDKTRHSCPFGNPIILNDSVYVRHAYSHELLCINDVNSAAINTTRYCKLPESSPGECFNDAHLVESCGDLFYIVIDWNGFRCDQISKVHAFKLDQDSMIWNKVEELDGRVFFINELYSVSSYNAGNDCHGGFVYYISHYGIAYSYSFAESSISTSLLFSELNLPITSALPVIYLADTRLIDGHALEINLVESRQCGADTRKITEKTNDISIDKENNGGENLLYCFPNDLIRYITRFLNPIDYLNFRSVSRTCKYLAPQVEWRKATNASPLSPWFMSTNDGSNIYSFVDSKLGGKYFMNIPVSLLDKRIMHSGDGWLLMCGYLEQNFFMDVWETLYFYNPLTTEIIKLPILQFNNTASIGFSWSPTSSKCIVVAIEATSISVFRIGWKRWQSCDVSDDDFFPNWASSYSPTFHNGSFYVLSCNGSLGVFELEDDERMSWRVLDITKEHWINSSAEMYLLPCDEKLLLVIIGMAGEFVKVFALNLTAMSWEKVDDLGNCTLYLGKSSSFLTSVRANWMKSVIFLPRLYEDSLVYYSIDTGKYHTLANNNKHEIVEYHCTRELLTAGWIQPSWC